MMDVQKYDLTLLTKVGGADAADWVEKTVAALGGKTGKMTDMGRKQMAYKINNLSEANYVSWALELPVAGVVQFEKKLTIESPKKDILRHLLIKAD